MQGIPAYVLSVTAAALLVSIAIHLVGEKGAAAAVLRMMCGIVMAVAVLRPLGDWMIPNLHGYFDDLTAMAEAAAQEGTKHTQEVLAQRISESTASYILDKAAALGVSLTVTVQLDSRHVPNRVVLVGNVSPAAKETLSQIIQQDIGIGREDQVWK